MYYFFFEFGHGSAIKNEKQNWLYLLKSYAMSIDNNVQIAFMN